MTSDQTRLPLRGLVCLAAVSVLHGGLIYAQDTGDASAESAKAQPSVVQVPAIEPQPADGQPHTISQVVIEYVRPIDGQPSADELLEAEIVVARTASGFVLPREGEPAERIHLADFSEQTSPVFYDSVLPLIAPAVVARLQTLGLIGVYVEPDPAQIRVEGGNIVDERAAGDTSLRLRITTGIVVDVRTNGLGERLPEDQTLNNPAHSHIRQNSPVQPAQTQEEATEGTRASSLLRRDLIDEYVYWLNRHAGRRVDVAVVPSGEDFGGVSVDYLVTENRPWMLFAQISNTGSDTTSELRERFGFIHNQLTNHDDTLSIDYLTGNFDEVNAVTGSYERPLFADDRVRGRVFSQWYSYTAGDVGLPNADFQGNGYTVGGELRWNFFQHRDLFLDLVGGLRFEHVEVDNDLVGTTGSEGFLIPSIAVRLERFRESERTSAGISLEGNVLNADEGELTEIGRFNADAQWVVLKFDAQHSFYIEPLLNRDPNKPTPLAHEIALSTRGQWAFDYRLIPNYEEVAGGLYTVRGYPESEVAGDSVFIASFEYRYHVPQGLSPKAQAGNFLGSSFRYAPQYVSGPTDWDLILKAFVDIGRSLNNDRLFFEQNQTLVGVGFGVDLVMTRRLTGRVDFGWALNDIESATGSNRVDSGDFEVHFVVTLIY